MTFLHIFAQPFKLEVVRIFYRRDPLFLLPLRFQKWPCFQKTQFGKIKCMPRFEVNVKQNITEFYFFRVSP